MVISALFPDHEVLARIMMEDINLPYDEWKEKVDKPIKPILNKMNKSVRDLVPALQKFRIYNRSQKESIRGRMRNSSIRWKYKSPNISLSKDIDVFVQFSDYHEDRKESIFWGIDWWGTSKESEPVYQFFKKVVNKGNIIKEVNGPGAGGTSISLVLKKYAADQLLDLKKDIIKEIAEDIKLLVQRMDGISKETINFQQEKHQLGYLPNKVDFETAYRMLARLGEDIPIDAVLEQIEINAKKLNILLNNDWRAITEKNIGSWSELK